MCQSSNEPCSFRRRPCVTLGAPVITARYLIGVLCHGKALEMNAGRQGVMLKAFAEPMLTTAQHFDSRAASGSR